MKAFYYDTVLDRENICNLERERHLLQQGASAGRKMVVYGPRNSGKTSLVKSVVIPDFRQKHGKSFIMFADLMEVKSIESIHGRIQAGFEEAFSRAFQRRSLLEAAKNILANLRAEVTLDQLTGAPTLSFGIGKEKELIPLSHIFSIVREKIAPEMPVLVVLDEFQDIAFIPEAQGLFRQALQEFSKTAIILMGSKQHILSGLFAKPNAPLAGFGEDIEFGPISYEDYHKYIDERFRDRKLRIPIAISKKLQDLLFRVPEAINIVCARIYETYHDKEIGLEEISSSIEYVTQARRSRFEEWLSRLSEKEEKILISIAKNGPVKYPNSQSFLKTVSTTPRTVSLTFADFLDKAIITKNEDGCSLTDPLLFYFLRRFR